MLAATAALWCPAFFCLVSMDRLAFLKAQPWLEDDSAQASAPVIAGAAAPAPPPLRSAENAFSAHEIYEGVATFAARAGDQPDGAEASEHLAFRASLLASRWETRIRLALQPIEDEHTPVPAGAKRRRGDGAAGERCRLLVRFETAGRSWQARVLHTQIERISENVTELPAPGTEASAPYLRLRLPPGLDLTITPLPELSPANGAEQLRRVLGRMMTSLPRAVAHTPAEPQAPLLGTQPRAAPVGCQLGEDRAAAPTEGLTREPVADVSARITSWQAFMRCVRELADELEDGAKRQDARPAAGADGTLSDAAGVGAPAFSAPRSGSGSAGGGGLFSRGGVHGGSGLLGSGALSASRQIGSAARPTTGSLGGGGSRPQRNSPGIDELLTALPIHMSHALPPTAAEGSALYAAAQARQDTMASNYVQHALAALQGSAPPKAAIETAHAASAASRGVASAGQSDDAWMAGGFGADVSLHQRREALKRAYASRLSAMLLPGRAT